MDRGRFGIAFRLMGGLLALVASTTLASLTGFLSLDQVGQQFAWTAHSEVPLLVAASRLSQESQSIAFIARDFRKIDNHVTLDTKLGEANDKLNALGVLVQSLDSLSLDAKAIASLHTSNDVLTRHFGELADVVGQRIDAEAEIQNRGDKLLKLCNDLHEQRDGLRQTIRAETNDGAFLATWADLVTATVSNTVSMSGYKTRPRLERLATQLDDLWRNAETQYGNMTPGLRVRLAPLRQVLAENAGSPPNFATKRLRLLGLEQTEAGMVNQAEILSSHLVVAAADLFFKTQKEVERRNTDVAALIERTSTLQAAAVALTLFVSLLILLYIDRSVIRRLSTLRTAMTDHAQGRGGPIAIAGRDEIGEMTRALSYFVEVIEDRQRALNAINADLTQAHHNLERIAVTDRLTGLCNRAKLDEAFAEALARTERLGEPLSIILADIDHFKAVNDTYGHQVGDSVLADFAALLRQLTRSTDTTGRWGGEEFLIICAQVDRDGTLVLAERIRAGVAEHAFSAVGQKTCSLGVATRRPGDTADSMVKRADDALYEAKQNGRNRVVLENPPR